MSLWVALGRDDAGYVGYAVKGDEVQRRAVGPDAPSVLDQLSAGDAAAVRVGQGDATRLPAPVLPPDGLTLPALTQDQPPDIISAWIRLWVAGHLALHPNWDGLICALHGDVVHWLHVSADEVVSSATSLTPRLYAALGMGTAEAQTDALQDTLSRPERLMTHLRAAEVQGDAGACLGHFIGADLAATRAYWLGQQALVIGDGDLARAYTQALQRQGVPVGTAAPDSLLPDGLSALGKQLFPTA